ncbi:hypothetical protein [Natronococcus sp. A-GB7]|uniref:DUF7344 domain-containing protein n=1 Tax=Natronococcus sp. A-GB7 TaxID=3037649 RepID=UPI00241F1AB8|nr:hypothetical protein [Natronococcus sp. A-GB7]MDG5821520.1 hypothetical protein [Natronococcus sp. A-GB7]
MDSQTALNLLANADRQHIVEELLENGGRSNVGVLSQQLAARRRNNADELQQEQARLELHHNHLPRLADHGVIEYDQRTGAIVLREVTELEPYLNEITRKRTVPLDHHADRA